MPCFNAVFFQSSILQRSVEMAAIFYLFLHSYISTTIFYMRGGTSVPDRYYVVRMLSECNRFALPACLCLSSQSEPQQNLYKEPEPHQNDAALQHWKKIGKYTVLE
jgi:hypothetical protein